MKARQRLRKVNAASLVARRAKAKVTRLRSAALLALKEARKELMGLKRSAKTLSAKYGKALETAANAIARYEPLAPVMMPTIEDDSLVLYEEFTAAIETQIETLESYTDDVEALE